LNLLPLQINADGPRGTANSYLIFAHLQNELR
jgi:hypothetical protein